MTQNESVSDYYDTVLGLLSGAKHTLEEKYNLRYGDEPESSIMMKPVIDCALDAFIRGLPEDMSIFVDTRNPKDLSEALEYALHIEERLNYAEQSRAVASSYHVSRKDTEPERPRFLSPYSKLMNPILKNEQKPATGNQKMVTFCPPHAGIPSGNYPQNYAPYPPPILREQPTLYRSTTYVSRSTIPIHALRDAVSVCTWLAQLSNGSFPLEKFSDHQDQTPQDHRRI